jgi:hypothetical protein
MGREGESDLSIGMNTRSRIAGNPFPAMLRRRFDPLCYRRTSHSNSAISPVSSVGVESRYSKSKKQGSTMDGIVRTSLGLVVFAPAFALAQSVFVGTWKADMQNDVQLPSKAYVFLLSGGTYHCKGCVPPYAVAADGQDHPVSGHPYFDTAAVKVVDEHTIQETDKKAGKVVVTNLTQVSTDGKTVVWDIVDGSATNADPVKFKVEGRRIAAAAAGAHPVSGSWKATRFLSLSDNGALTTWSLSGNTLSMTTPTGQSYAAPLDGSDVPYSGDAAQSSISMKTVNDHTVQETDKRDGKVIGTATLTVSRDGTRMTVVWDDVFRHTHGSFVNVKQ